MATATKKTLTFGVSCPFCADPDAVVRINLNDLNACTCSSCDEEFSPSQARDLVADQLRRWERVVEFVADAAERLGL